MIHNFKQNETALNHRRFLQFNERQLYIGICLFVFLIWKFVKLIAQTWVKCYLFAFLFFIFSSVSLCWLVFILILFIRLQILAFLFITLTNCFIVQLNFIHCFWRLFPAIFDCLILSFYNWRSIIYQNTKIVFEMIGI